MVYITRKETFSAAHRLYQPAWSEETNQAVFGNCANPNGHGHNFTLEVTVKGEPDPMTGYFINLKTLKQLIRQEIIEPMDGRYLNTDVSFLEGKMPTIEVLAQAIWHRLAPHLQTCQLHRVRLYETENNSAEYYGEG
jgi:6-pyruvoyltetrahydropterin/6-carboxytetrahydropterin synthase